MNEKLRLNAIFLFFFPSNIRSHGYQIRIRHHRVRAANRTRHWPELLLQVYTNFSLATRRLIARLYPYLNSISLSLSPRNELLSRPSFDKTNRDYFQKLELFLLNPIRLSSLRNNLIKEFINTKLFARWFLSNFLVVHKHETVRSLISLSRRSFSTFLNVLNKLVTTRGDF